MASHGELSSHSTSDEDEDIKSEKVIQQNVCKRPGSAEPKIQRLKSKSSLVSPSVSRP